MSERVSFKVKNNKFWILEQRIEEETEAKVRKKGEEEEYKVNAWVFNNEEDAIKKLRELISQEKIDFNKLDDIERIGAKYNLQEVEIAREKYNMRAISWLKVALLGFLQK
jgi:hypothetical protein